MVSASKNERGREKETEEKDESCFNEKEKERLREELIVIVDIGFF